MRLRIEDENSAAPMWFWTAHAEREVRPQLQGHIESGEFRPRINLHTGNVVNRKVADRDHVQDRREANASTVAVIESAAWAVATRQQGEARGAQERPVGVVERAVYENESPAAALVVGNGRRPLSEGFRHGALDLRQRQARRDRQPGQIDTAIGELWRPLRGSRAFGAAG